jgi:hypothetical protein
VVLLPVTLVLLGGFLGLRSLRGRPTGAAFLSNPWPAWAARAALAVVFVLAVLDLQGDLSLLQWEPPGY